MQQGAGVEWNSAQSYVGQDPPAGLASGVFMAMQRGALDSSASMLAFRDTITSIAVVVPSGNTRGAQDEQSIDFGEYSIEARQSPMYRAAIMCGSR